MKTLNEINTEIRVQNHLLKNVLEIWISSNSPFIQQQAKKLAGSHAKKILKLTLIKGDL